MMVASASNIISTGSSAASTRRAIGAVAVLATVVFLALGTGAIFSSSSARSPLPPPAPTRPRVVTLEPVPSDDVAAPTTPPPTTEAPEAPEVWSIHPSARRRNRGSALETGERVPVTAAVFIDPLRRPVDGGDDASDEAGWFDPRSPGETAHLASFAATLPVQELLEPFASGQISQICTFVWITHEAMPRVDDHHAESGDAAPPPLRVERSAAYEKILSDVLSRVEMPHPNRCGASGGDASRREAFVLVVRAPTTTLSDLHLIGMRALLAMLEGKPLPLIRSPATSSSPSASTPADADETTTATTTHSVHRPAAAILLDAAFAPMITIDAFLHAISMAFSGADRAVVGCPVVDFAEGRPPLVLHGGYDLRPHQRAGGAAFVPLYVGGYLEDVNTDAAPDALPPSCIVMRAADAASVSRQPMLSPSITESDAASSDAAEITASAVSLIAGLKGAIAAGTDLLSALPRFQTVPDLRCPLQKLQTVFDDALRAIDDFKHIVNTSATFVAARRATAERNNNRRGGPPLRHGNHDRLSHRCTNLQNRYLSAVSPDAIPPMIRTGDASHDIGLLDVHEGSHAMREKRDRLFATVSQGTVGARGAFLHVHMANVLQMLALHMGNYGNSLALLHRISSSDACARCADDCETRWATPTEQEAYHGCRATQQVFAGVFPALPSMLDVVRDGVRRLKAVNARVGAMCGGATDSRGWVRVSLAMRQAGLVTVLPKAASVVVAPTPGGFQALPCRVRAASLVRQPGWLAVTLSAEDPVGALVERSVKSKFATLGARVHWSVPCSCCGFSVEAAWILQGLRERVDVVLPQDPRCFCARATTRTGGDVFDESLWHIFATPTSFRRQTFLTARSDPDDVVEIAVHHWDPSMEHTLPFAPIANASADVRIMRTMYEFSRIPTSWNEKLLSERFDEVWVPGEVVRQAYIRSGIPAETLVIVPEAVDVELFSPSSPVAAVRLPLPPGAHRSLFAGSGNPIPREELHTYFKFCSVSKFEPRKGWDVLFRAFFEAFNRQSKVSLHLRTFLWGEDQLPGATSVTDNGAILHHIVHEYGVRKWLPPVEVITQHMTDEQLVGLFKGCDAFVLPSRGEGWGLPMMQAMALGIPTITTNGSGMSAFTTHDTVIYVEADEVRVPEAARKLYKLPYATQWLEPRHASLVDALKRVVAMPAADRRALGERARAHIVKNFSPAAVADIIAKRVVALERSVRARWAANGAPPLQGGDALRAWNCSASFAQRP